MTTFLLASAGGGVSFVSTAVGVLLTQFRKEDRAESSRFSLSIDFALGLMLSASAFSLIGPAAIESNSLRTGTAISMSVLAGMVFVYFLKWLLEQRQKKVESLQTHEQQNAAQLLLASVLMLHNFPEGLASGAAMAGLNWHASLPILGGIAVQNIPEGALMVLCLRALGWSNRNAFLGGLASAFVEMSGGVLAGLLLQVVGGILPLLLSFAGGAMIMSVLAELLENKAKTLSRIWSYQFLMGLLCLPLMKLIGL